jgi:hypothetical protein
MSGYLQRLVSTAAAGAELVHPRTGSIFSPRHDEASSPLHDVEESETVTAALERPSLERAPGPDVSHGELMRRVRSESVYAPLLPAVEAPAQDAARPAAPASRAMLSDRVEPVVARALQPGEPRRNSHDAAQTVIAPQLPRPAENPVRPLTNASDASQLAAPPPARRRMPQERYADRTERQSDDIQIHIGRIEVVAVPPPAPRPPRAPDRSLSLDEYLSRRDSRPRR